MIKTVVFDIGNVLAAFDYRTYMKQFSFSEEKEDHLAHIIFESALWNERDRGALRDEEILEEYLLAYPEEREDILLVFSKILEVVKPYDFSGEWIRKVKSQGYQVLFLSNYAKSNFEYAMEHFEFLQYGDGGVISYREKLCKPEAGIYQILLERYQLKAEECVFLDDTKKNLVAAEAFGFQTIHVTSHEAAVAGLKKLGIES